MLYNHATGDYVVNLDGDDYYTDPDFISEAVKLIAPGKNLVMIVARATTKTTDKQCVSLIPKYQSVIGMQILRNLPASKYFIMHMTVMYARQSALKIDFYRSPVISSDWESLYRLSLLGTVQYLNRNVGVWRIHDSNETGTTDPAKQLENLTIWPVIYKDAVAFGMNAILAKFICARCIAFFIQSSCEKISMDNNAVLVKFIMDVYSKYKFATFLLILTPVYTSRVLLSLTGYYRRKRLL